MRADWVEERVVTEADRVVSLRDESVNQFAISANRKHPGRSPSSEEERAEHEVHDNEEHGADNEVGVDRGGEA